MGTPHSSVTQDHVDEIIDDWPDDPTNVAETVVDEYGPPDEAIPSRLIWHDNGPWKRSVLYREGVPHKFPAEHVDYFEQVIDYQVSPDRYDELGRFDGSVTVRRTRGELSAECHGEPANFLALNLAHDILTGEKSVDEARNAYSEIYAQKEAGGTPDYIQDLQFELPTDDQRDTDEKTVTDEMKARATEQIEAE